MKITKLLNSDENRAVSPVIGVILMVAITVILAAVIGTFVLGLGDQVQQTSPNAQFDWEEGTDADGDTVTVTHESGADIDPTTLEVTGAGTSPLCHEAGDASGAWQGTSDSQVTAGASCTLTEGDSQLPSDNPTTLRLIWESSEGGSSSTLTSHEYEP